MTLTARARNQLAYSSVSLSIASGGTALIFHNNYEPRIEFVAFPFLASVIAALLAMFVIAYCLIAKHAISIGAILAVIFAVVSYVICDSFVREFYWNSVRGL